MKDLQRQADFFFSDTPAPSASEVDAAQGSEQPIPEGFFDDPVLDAKVCYEK